jgi:hypothetical protein
MKRFIKMLGRKTAPRAHKGTTLLGEHFASIRTTAVEIRDYREKIIYPTPTSEVRKRIDINHAWPSSRELLVETFSVLNGIAGSFDIEPGGFVRGDGFIEALDALIKTVDRIMYGLVDAIGTGRFSPKQIRAIDDRILLVQSGMNRLRKHVLEDFRYPVSSVRPLMTDNYHLEGDEQPMVTNVEASV